MQLQFAIYEIVLNYNLMLYFPKVSGFEKCCQELLNFN